jgi:NitT/TauT family transport system ATP-binding protein
MISSFNIRGYDAFDPLDYLSLPARTALAIVFVTHDIPEAVYMGTDIYIMQANPGRIVHHIAIDLPFDKTRQVKRDPRFVQYVYGIEDNLI